MAAPDGAKGGRKARRAFSMLEMERYLAGRMPAEEAAAYRAELAARPEWAAYVERQAAAPPLLTAPPSRAPAMPVRMDRRPWGRPRFRNSAIAFAALVLALLPALWMRERKATVPPLAAKGEAGATVALRIGEVTVGEGQEVRARAGDTLGFSYRHPRDLHVRVWFRDDGKAPEAFAGREEKPLLWPAASGWRISPQRVLLRGGWRREDILVAWSESPFGTAEGLAAVGSGGTGSIHVAVFHLRQSP